MAIHRLLLAKMPSGVAQKAAMSQSRAIWWVKRDMRLTDNEALNSAIEQHQHVVALFICEPSLYNAPDTSPMHVFAWWQGTSSLQKALRNIGGELYFGQGEAVDVFEHLFNIQRFDAIYSHEETGNATTFKRDRSVKQWCENKSVKWTEKSQSGVVRGYADRDKRTEIANTRLFEVEPIAAPVRIHTWSIDTDSIVNTQWPEYTDMTTQVVDERIQFRKMQQVNEPSARDELQHFLENRVNGYSRGIASPNSAFQTGSRLSTHLAWGTISARDVHHQSTRCALEFQQSRSSEAAHGIRNIRAFQSRLHWRDHFIQRLESASYMEHQALNPAFEQIAYIEAPELLQAWINGNTGIPLVDACMRCLLSTGFLNFRMRAMLVTTGCFGMQLSWRELQYPLARVFYDYEPGIHFSQMQMQAGIVGINTMRVYSPHKQLLDQDADCRFIKQWIPELRKFTSTEIANYNNQPLGDYPTPICDIKTNSTTIKNQISQIKKSEEAKEPTADILAKHGSRLRPNKKTTNKPSPQLKLPF